MVTDGWRDGLTIILGKVVGKWLDGLDLSGVLNRTSIENVFSRVRLKSERHETHRPESSLFLGIRLGLENDIRA